jgi:hypothetical protein
MDDHDLALGMVSPIRFTSTTARPVTWSDPYHRLSLVLVFPCDKSRCFCFVTLIMITVVIAIIRWQCLVHLKVSLQQYQILPTGSIYSRPCT